MRNFSFCYNIFKSRLHGNVSLGGKWFTSIDVYSYCILLLSFVCFEHITCSFTFIYDFSSPSVISGKLSPNKICKSPPPNFPKPRPTSGSQPNTGTQKDKNEEQTGTADLGTEAVPAKILKSSTGSKLQTEQNMKENVSRPNTGTRIKFDSRPSSTSKLGSRPGAGSRFGRQGSGVRQKGMR